jgi:hypothetical protein
MCLLPFKLGHDLFKLAQRAYGSAATNACDSATISACDSAATSACDSAATSACDSAATSACGFAATSAWRNYAKRPRGLVFSLDIVPESLLIVAVIGIAYGQDFSYLDRDRTDDKVDPVSLSLQKVCLRPRRQSG